LGATKGWLIYAEATRRVMPTHYKDLPMDEKPEVCIEEDLLVRIEHLRTHLA
jgi:hypothetical protein